MDQFLLTDDLLSGMDDVDAQHRMLFDLANQIVDPATPRGADASFFASLAFMSEYVNYHFAAEELAMREASYPQRELHCRLHVEFREKIAALVEASLEVTTVTELRLALADAVAGWLTDHIRIADKALATYLRRHAGSSFPGLPEVDALVAAGYLERPIDLSEFERTSETESAT